jgi:hypothetical protein
MSRGRFFEGFIIGVIATILGLFVADHYTEESDEIDEDTDNDEQEEVESRVSKTLDAIEDKFDKLSEFVDSKRSN